MRNHEIEAWVLAVIDRVVGKQPAEDSRVELKAEWPDPKKAARRIAGHCNAARGDYVLWLIGVDEKAGTVPGAPWQDLATWLPAVRSEFDELSPASVELNVPYNGVTVAAILFETDRGPFVVKNPTGQGNIDREVPWRDGTLIRSAHRSELLRILSPLQKLPTFELLSAYLYAYLAHRDSTKPVGWQLDADLFAVPNSKDRVVVAAHNCEASFEVLGLVAQSPLENLSFRVMAANTLVTTTGTELILDGPGRFQLTATLRTPFPGAGFEAGAVAAVTLRTVGEGVIHLEAPLTMERGDKSADSYGKWSYRPEAGDYIRAWE
jgi:hypothetical protein